MGSDDAAATDPILSSFPFIREYSKYDIDISIQEADDMTALHYATLNHFDISKIINVKDDGISHSDDFILCEATALWHATTNVNLETIELVCKKNSSCDVNTKYDESDLVLSTTKVISKYFKFVSPRNISIAAMLNYKSNNNGKKKTNSMNNSGHRHSTVNDIDDGDIDYDVNGKKGHRIRRLNKSLSISISCLASVEAGLVANIIINHQQIAIGIDAVENEMENEKNRQDNGDSTDNVKNGRNNPKSVNSNNNSQNSTGKPETPDDMYSDSSDSDNMEDVGLEFSSAYLQQKKIKIHVIKVIFQMMNMWINMLMKM